MITSTGKPVEVFLFLKRPITGNKSEEEED
jgi:hypothetical protein